MNIKKNGFTLIELTVVIGVIAVLTASLIFIIDPVTQIAKARDAQRKSDLSQIQSALELYRSDVGRYPPADTVVCAGTIVNGSVTYMRKVPCDPKPTNPSYSYAPSGSSIYSITACLEFVPAGTPKNCNSSKGTTFTLQNP